MAKSSSDMPEDAITEILLRLPVKSSLRFQMVSKPWLSIILDSKFVRSHCHIAAQENPKLLVRESLPDNRPDFEYVYMSEVFSSRYNIIGSCNGIACLSKLKCDGYKFYLWNPSIKKYKKLPPTIDAGNRVVQSLGFGYDSLSNDYKVVLIQYLLSDSIDFGNLVRVQLFSTNADSWSDHVPILPPNYSHDYSGYGLFINGVLYFELRDEKNKLISFDLHHEVFKVILLPTCVLETRSKLLDFEGSLAILSIDSISDGSVHQEISRWREDDDDGSVEISLRQEDDDDDDRPVHQQTSLWTLEEGCEPSRINWIKRFIFEADLWVDMYLGAGEFFGCSLQGDCVSREIISHVCYDDNKKCNSFHLRYGELPGIIKYTESLVTFQGFRSTEWLSQELSSRRLQEQEEEEEWWEKFQQECKQQEQYEEQTWQQEQWQTLEQYEEWEQEQQRWESQQKQRRQW